MPITNRIVQERPVLYRPNMQVVTQKERVVAYARVSTDRDEQEDSFENQCKHFTELINSRSDWEFGGIYADQGISGTKAATRKEFMRMIEDCRIGKIDRVFVKSISRFARNTVDSLMFIRELKELGVSVFFESEQIDTLTPGGEVLITILSAIAEQESRNMSTNIKWAYQKRFKDGNVLIGHHTLGYGKGENGYDIVEDEAETVRRIYREFIGGAACRQIALDLMQDQIKTATDSTTWSTSAVQNILQNEKYTGNAILGKTFKADVLSKTRLKNEGQAPSFYVKNSHPAIIEESVFEMAQAELKRRKELRSVVKTGDGKYSSLYALSGLLVCGECGGKFRRYGRKIASGDKVATWVCISHQQDSDRCHMLPLKEEDIHKAYKRIMDRLAGDVSDVIQKVTTNIEIELSSTQNANAELCEEEIVNYQKKVIELFKRKREGAIFHEEYDREYKEYSERIAELQARQTKYKEDNLAAEISKQRLDEIRAVLNGNLNLYDEGIMRILIECIKVNGKHEVEFQFKCGIKTTEKV